MVSDVVKTVQQPAPPRSGELSGTVTPASVFPQTGPLRLASLGILARPPTGEDPEATSQQPGSLTFILQPCRRGLQQTETSE